MNQPLPPQTAVQTPAQTATGVPGALSLPPSLAWLAADAVPAEPWRNGGGSTRTLLTWPAGTGPAGPWRLRISLADITQDGPFSAFAGVQRWFAVVQGGGVRLQPPAADGRAPAALCLRPDSPAHHFDGAQPPDCQLLHGPTRDLNLMLRGLDGGLVAAQPGQPWRPPPGAWCAALVDGPATVSCGAHRLRLPGLGLLHAGLPNQPGGPDTSASGHDTTATPTATGTGHGDHTAHPPAADAWCLNTVGSAARAWWLWARLPQPAPPSP